MTKVSWRYNNDVMNSTDGEGPVHYGVCSNYLMDRKPGDEVYLFIRRYDGIVSTGRYLLKVKGNRLCLWMPKSLEQMPYFKGK